MPVEFAAQDRQAAITRERVLYGSLCLFTGSGWLSRGEWQCHRGIQADLYGSLECSSCALVVALRLVFAGLPVDAVLMYPRLRTVPDGTLCPSTLIPPTSRSLWLKGLPSSIPPFCLVRFHISPRNSKLLDKLVERSLFCSTLIASRSAVSF